MLVAHLIGLFRALYKGQSLLHVEAWKNVQLVTDALVAIAVSLLVFAPQLNITQADVLTLCTAIAMIGSVISGYFTVATTEKIGLPTIGNGDNRVQPESDNEGDSLQVSDSTKSSSVSAGGKGLLGR